MKKMTTGDARVERRGRVDYSLPIVLVNKEELASNGLWAVEERLKGGRWMVLAFHEVGQVIIQKHLLPHQEVLMLARR